MMVGINRLKTLIPYVAIASSVNLILSIWLIPKIGIYGTGVGLIAGNFMLCCGFLFRILKEFKLPLKEFLKESILYPALLTFALCLLFIGSSNIYANLAGVGAYFMFASILIAREDTKNLFRAATNSVFRPGG